MKLPPDQLAEQLREGLRPLYLITGDEPLQLGEAADAVRAAAREQGYGERQVMHAGATGFDWSELAASASALSLFAERKLIDLRLPGGKPGDAGAKALVAYAEAPPEGTVLLITSGKLDGRQQQSKWFKALERAGLVVQVWPVESGQLTGWITRRMRSRGLEANADAARLIAERVEGNLLAAAQEIDKLRLLVGAGPVDGETVLQAVADSARYDVFGLTDAILGGTPERVIRMLDGLRGEGTEAPIVLWALAREARLLSKMAAAIEAGEPRGTVLQRNGVWQRRRPLVEAALRRHPARRWARFLARGARIDRIIKGAAPGNPWDELLQLALAMAGVRYIH